MFEQVHIASGVIFSIYAPVNIWRSSLAQNFISIAPYDEQGCHIELQSSELSYTSSDSS